MHPLIYLLMILAVMALAFMVLRRVFLWYWKVNERIELMKEQNAINQKILDKLTYMTDRME